VPARRRRAANVEGFSLAELIIVVTLVAILSTAVIPVFRGSFASIQADHAVRDFVAIVKYVQERAVTDSKEYRIYLVPQTGQYWTEYLASLRNGKKTFEPLKERQGAVMQLPELLAMKKVQARKDKERDIETFYIAFYPNGVCDTASVTLVPSEGKPTTIDTQGALGQLEVNNKRW
jgi:prepilin-type N-terminal cleavage/methylation domain-containing protein